MSSLFFSALSSPHSSKKGGGFEEIRFFVDENGIRSLVSKADSALGDKQLYINTVLTGWITAEPRPDPRDVYRVRIEGPIDNRFEITLVVRRGHYSLASFLNEHEDILIKKSGEARCSCHPGETKWFLPDSFPDYWREEDVEA